MLGPIGFSYLGLPVGVCKFDCNNVIFGNGVCKFNCNNVIFDNGVCKFDCNNVIFGNWAHLDHSGCDAAPCVSAISCKLAC